MSKRQINYDIDKQLTAQRLKEAMNDAGLTLSELSEKSKVSKSSISQYTHALKSPSNLSAGEMAKVLEVSPVWLMGFDTPKSRDEYINSRNERLSAYANYAIAHLYLAKIYDKLPLDGKKEFKNFAEYLKTKYNITEEGANNEREHNKEEK